MRGIRNFRDIVRAVTVLPVALVVMGYAFLAAKAAIWLVTNGWPAWVALCALPAITFFGMWQGYLFYTKWPFSKDKNPPGHDSKGDSHV